MMTSRNSISLCMTFALFAALLLGTSLLTGCQGNVSEPASPAYADVVRAFSVGVATLQVEDKDRGLTELLKTTALAPNEPAGWANLGLKQIRAGKLEDAAVSLEKAQKLAPKSSEIAALVGLLESLRGNYAASIAAYRTALELDPTNLAAAYAQFQQLQRQGGPGADAEINTLLTKILEADPTNLAVLLEIARNAAIRGDKATLRQSIDRLTAVSTAWSPGAQEQLQALREAASGANIRPAATRVAFLTNALVTSPALRQSKERLGANETTPGRPLLQFLVLPPIPRNPEPADSGLTYTVTVQPEATAGSVVRAAYLTRTSAPALFRADSDGPQPVSRPINGTPLTADLLAVDFNEDFKTDFVVVGMQGMALYQQTGEGAFTNVTAKAGIPATLTREKWIAAFAVDIDLEGDLDIVLLPLQGAVQVLRNNGDGTFTAIPTFPGITGATDFAWSDFDGDGDPDAAFAIPNGLSLFLNQRSGVFTPAVDYRFNIGSQTQYGALTVADFNNDGILDIVGVQNDGSVIGTTLNPAATQTSTGASSTPPITSINLGKTTLQQPTRLFTADLDNNGAIDLVITDGKMSEVLLANEKAKLAVKDRRTVALRTDDVADMNGDGLLDLVGVTGEGAKRQVVVATGKGTKNYHFVTLKPFKDETAGQDRRINSFGIGGEVEIRAGLLAQKRPITAPAIHFGLGKQTQADVARFIWPNGSSQAEFAVNGDQTIEVKQRLTGSCPFLFAWDGTQMRFVTDCIWRSPLGMRINAQVTAGIAMTEDWVKIRGNQLKERTDDATAPYYDLRITADLWETHFFDHLSLMAVDHPEGTEIWVDERFSVPPPPLAVITTGPVTPVEKATADSGADLTEVLQARDQKYADYFGRGVYRGVTRDHFVEMELGNAAKTGKGPLYLIAQGCIYPTDSSSNVAISQGRNAQPSGMALETPDGKGGWRTAKTGLGFPAGKMKTVVLRVDDILNGGTKLRLRTNLEIYWDTIGSARGIDTNSVSKKRMNAQTANLQYRGFVTVDKKDASSPELPVAYEPVQSQTQRWRDLEGFYTRYGDIRELLTGVDDRYVIMNAGDEIRLRFPALPAPKPGFVRDFVLIGDGWVKDGNLNTAFSQTVLPLPSHADATYSVPPTTLENDPVYRKHRADWETYHTRYVTPDQFRAGLFNLPAQPAGKK